MTPTVLRPDDGHADPKHVVTVGMHYLPVCCRIRTCHVVRQRTRRSCSKGRPLVGYDVGVSGRGHAGVFGVAAGKSDGEVAVG
jgi:hypothetical protein